MSAEYLREGIAGKHSTLAGTASCDDEIGCTGIQ